MADPTCAACGRATPIPTKVRRLPGVVVVIGFVLLTASVVGGGIGLLVLFGEKYLAESRSTPTEQLRGDLRATGVPEPLVAKAMGESEELLTTEELRSLDGPQRLAVQNAQVAAISREVDPGLLRTGARMILVASLVGLVLGWTLRSKKTVLRCPSCRTSFGGA